MNLRTLERHIASGAIDTVLVGAPDVFGRLMGKRFTGRHFLEHVAGGATHGCNYLLAVNLEMEPQDGFALVNWEKGFGDFEFRPDLATLRILPWQPGAALVFADLHHPGGEAVAEAPRSLLRAQAAKLRRRGWACAMASELEFYLYQQSYPEACQRGYQGLVPSSDYRIDYHLMQPTRDEALMRAARNGMTAAGIPIESSKGEWGRGQHEINFTHADPVTMADRHTLFKQGLKELAQQHGQSITFMPKVAVTEAGSSCHIHVSLWRGGAPLFWDARARGGSRVFRQFLGGLLKYSRELSYFFAPTVNAYKRYQAGSWAPTTMAWSPDNRTVGFRVVGQGGSFRIENRMPGADANPYLAFAAMLAAGQAGIEEALDCGDAYEGNAYVDARLPALPTTLAQAVELLAGSRLARRALGDAVVEFYVHTGRLEVRAFNQAVTDWERRRYFEQI
ncbi:MAG TPA: glutamine synthetase family protein [Verrucomicrobiota bacterium]|nr:glutamine synthetase family protein [Verrucomicrobiota bacterium]